MSLGNAYTPSAGTLTPRQLAYVTRAAALLPLSAQAQFRQQVAVLLGYAQHPMDDRGVLDILRLELAAHGLSVSAVLPEPPREYARLERINRHAITSPIF